MITETMPAPTRAHSAAGEDPTHLYCCDPDRSLCGETLTGQFMTDDDPTDCIRCEIIDAAQAPCGVPLCRLRNWWRSR